MSLTTKKYGVLAMFSFHYDQPVYFVYSKCSSILHNINIVENSMLRKNCNFFTISHVSPSLIGCN